MFSLLRAKLRAWFQSLVRELGSADHVDWQKKRKRRGKFHFIEVICQLIHECIFGFLCILTFSTLYIVKQKSSSIKFHKLNSVSKAWGLALNSSVGKESTCNSGDPSSIPGLRRSTGEGIGYPLQYSWASLVAQLVKNLPAMWETWVRSVDWEDPLEKGKATHFHFFF